MDKESTILELSRSLALPLTREVTHITMEAILIMEEAHITTVPLRMGMGMEQATARTAPIQQPPPRRT